MGIYMKKILIIGAGASGMMAAICAANDKSHVTIYERNEKAGKKLLATGNGKCNLTNMDMGTEHYYTEDTDKLARCLLRFSQNDTISFFENMGLMTRQKDGYVYPYCEQASAVLDVFLTMLTRKEIALETGVESICISHSPKKGFVVTSSKGKHCFDAVILACGSKAGIKNANGDGYDLAKNFGHRIKKLYPALVQVRCKESFFSMIAGVRVKGKVSLYVDDRIKSEERGEIQLTDYGISGIPVFQMSRLIAESLDRGKQVKVILDFFPHMSVKEWCAFYTNRIKEYEGRTMEEFLLGLLHKKISILLLKDYGLYPSDRIQGSISPQIQSLCDFMKAFVVTPKQVNPFEQAQVCSGGVAFDEVDDHMQSIYRKDLYICGEMLDIDGKCGGYNLQWAWTSGYLAGTHAAL